MSRRTSEPLRRSFLSPAVAVTVTFFILPMCIICGYSVMERGAYGGVAPGFTAANYLRAIDPLYATILLRSLLLAAVSTVLCLVLGFPMAWVIANAGRRRNVLLNLVMLPFWTSFLIRTYAWMFLLRDSGWVNAVLLRLHVIASPLPLLFNDGSVILGLVYGYLPFMILPVYASLEKLDPALVDAAHDLGANRWATLWRVIIPLTRPGIAAGVLLVFIPCLGAYLTPDLLGGGKTLMIGNLIQNQFTTGRDWPFGSALSLLLLGLILVLLIVFLSRRGDVISGTDLI